MKGLLLKDFYCLKQNLKYMFFVLLLFGIIFIPQGNNGFSSVLIMLFAMMVITTLSYDHAGKWDNFALTMPITRKMLVQSKYVLLLLMLLAGIVISLLCSVIGAAFKGFLDFTETGVEIGTVAMVAVWMASLLLPLIYKFGVERARLFLMLVFALPVVIIMVVTSMFKDVSMPNITPEQLAPLAAVLPILTIFVYIVSYMISVKIYQKKEL